MELISSIAVDRAARSAHCGMSVYVLNAVLCKQASSHSYRGMTACSVVGLGENSASPTRTTCKASVLVYLAPESPSCSLGSVEYCTVMLYESNTWPFFSLLRLALL